MGLIDTLKQQEKLPPQNLDAEVAALGSMLIDEDAITREISASVLNAVKNNMKPAQIKPVQDCKCRSVVKY